MNPDELRKHFPNASASVLAANRDAGRSELHRERPDEQEGKKPTVRHELEPDNATPALRKKRAKEKDTSRFLVRVTSFRRFLIDEDNLSEKAIVDCCRYSGLLPGDSPRQTKIEVCQIQVAKGEEEFTRVEIYVLTSEQPAETTP